MVGHADRCHRCLATRPEVLPSLAVDPTGHSAQAGCQVPQHSVPLKVAAVGAELLDEPCGCRPYTLRKVRWSPSMCENRALASSAALAASFGRMKHGGTYQRDQCAPTRTGMRQGGLHER